jgi:hypothetical protein
VAATRSTRAILQINLAGVPANKGRPLETMKPVRRRIKKYSRAESQARAGQPISQCRPLREARIALGISVMRDGFGPGRDGFWGRSVATRCANDSGLRKRRYGIACHAGRAPWSRTLSGAVSKAPGHRCLCSSRPLGTSRSRGLPSLPSTRWRQPEFKLPSNIVANPFFVEVV